MRLPSFSRCFPPLPRQPVLQLLFSLLLTCSSSTGANADLLPSIAAWFRPLTGAAPYNKPQVEAAKAKAEKHLAYLEEALATRTFLVGERISLGDIFVASALFRGFENVLDAEWRKANPNTVRFWQTVIHQEHFFSVLGNVEPSPVEKAVVFTPPKKEAKPAKEKAADAPKKEKAAPKPKAKEVEEEEEPLVADEPKPKHPAELLGKPASFPLDEWKRVRLFFFFWLFYVPLSSPDTIYDPQQYSNNDTPVALNWLKENFNSNDYTIVRADYSTSPFSLLFILPSRN